ncbi:hypothetical protein [Hyphobacterium sp.]|uniref:hypothetical protein n=1 Tax=Hyphobacterium sp. TaxID=2004662 RepID=UPI003BA87D86
MMRPIQKISYIVALLCLCLAGGCQSLQGAPSQYNSREARDNAIAAYIEVINENSIEAYFDESDAQTRLRIRNNFLEARLGQIDIYYREFVSELMEESTSLNVFVDTSVATLNAAGTIAFGGHTNEIFSATASSLQGLKGAMNSNAFFEQSLPALITTMEAQRLSVYGEIRASQECGPTCSAAENLAGYPISRVLADIARYESAGTIPLALTQINRRAGEALTNAELQLRQAVSQKRRSKSERRV